MENDRRKKQGEGSGAGVPPIDGNAVSQVLRLDDETLRAAVKALASAGGMDEKRADLMTRDADKIRRKLSGINSEDLQKLLSRITPEQLAALSEQLKQLQKP